MKSTGIYLTNGTIRAAELSGSARRPYLARFTTATLAQGDRPEEVLGRLIREHGLSTGRVCVSLGGEGAVVRRLVLPVSNPRSANKAVRFQAEELLCGESLEDVVVDHEIVGPAEGGGTQVLVLIVKKRKVAAAMSVLEGAGIAEAGVTLDGAALFNLAAVSHTLAPEGRTALIDFDGPSLRILVANSGKLEVFRSVRLPEEAEGAELDEAVVRELERTLAGAEIGEPLSGILLTGKEAGDRALVLSERFVTDAQVLDVGQTLGNGGIEQSWGAGVAAGAALKGLNAERLPADFRKDEFAPRGETRRVYLLGVYALGAMALLFAILLAGSIKRLGSASDAHDKVTAEAIKYWKKVYPKKPFPRIGFDKHITKLDKEPAGNVKKGPGYDSFLEALLRVSHAAPGEGIQMYALAFDQQKVVLNGEVDGMERFESFVENLKARFGVRVKPHLERRRRGRGEFRTSFKIEIPKPKDTR